MADQLRVVPPSAADLLLAWEWGLPTGAEERGLALLSSVLPDEPGERLRSMTVGERDAHLLDARRMLFGPDLDCVVSCPECSAALELRVAVDDLLAHAPRPSAPDDGDELAVGGWTVRFRRVTLRDLLEARAASDAASARRALLERCVVASARPGGADVPGVPEGGLPPDVEGALLEAMERREPLAALDFAFACPACGHTWTAPFDVVGFLWAEVDGWAQRTLHEVHLLASSYGWREADILALTPWRRDAYLRMTGHG